MTRLDGTTFEKLLKHKVPSVTPVRILGDTQAFASGTSVSTSALHCAIHGSGLGVDSLGF